MLQVDVPLENLRNRKRFFIKSDFMYKIKVEILQFCLMVSVIIVCFLSAICLWQLGTIYGATCPERVLLDTVRNHLIKCMYVRGGTVGKTKVHGPQLNISMNMDKSMSKIFIQLQSYLDKKGINIDSINPNLSLYPVLNFSKTFNTKLSKIFFVFKLV